MATTPKFTIPGLTTAEGEKLAGILQERLNALNDLQLTLKHVHWNVVGPHFIAVHEMIDPQVDLVRGFADDLAERIATLGGSPTGTPAALVEARTWEEYSLGRATTQQHLGALDLVYRGVITTWREAMAELEKLDAVTQDMLTGQVEQLELFHWFIRAHLEDQSGNLATVDATDETEAAVAASETE
ncbi:MAG: dps [Aeromicrobium sp.]|nr:dps [Aeromicrobium sp.]